MTKAISPGFSLYLDVVRLTAAFVVLLSHIWPLLFPGLPLPWPGHAAVVVFFVLSGYVIALATDRADQNASTYVLHRVVRIMSVTIPALLLAVVIAPYVAGKDPIPGVAAMTISASDFWYSTWMNLVFLGESWFDSITPPFNIPFWSISYEVWYYIIFGVWVYSRPAWRSWFTVVAVCLAGLNIALLLPVWLLGVALYRKGICLPKSIAPAVFFGSLVAGLAFFWFDCSIEIRNYLITVAPTVMNSLHGSNQFVGDYLLGLIVAIHFAAAALVREGFGFLKTFTPSIRYLASFTLSIYLFHMPLTVFIWNGLQIRSLAGFSFLLISGIFIMGSLTERKNKLLRNWATRMLGGIGTIYYKSRERYVKRLSNR